MNKTISGVIGKGSIQHNNRNFYAENVNKNRSQYNIQLKRQNIKDAYHKLFDDALNEYNSKQKRADRKISDYYEHIRISKQEKTFYEVIFQIGDMNNTASGTPDGDVAGNILKEFYYKFQENNPHIHIFNAIIHMDEATPHLHIDFIPFATDCKRGLSTKNSLSGALRQQGFESSGKFNTCTTLWINKEKERLAECMTEHNIGWEIKGEHRAHLSVEQYKLKEYRKENELLENSISRNSYELSKLNNEINLKQDKLNDISERSEQVEKFNEIKPKSAIFSNKIKIKENDYEQLFSAAQLYYARESNEEELSEQVKYLEKENTTLKHTVNAQSKELSRYKSLDNKINTSKIAQEIKILQAKLDKIMQFIANMNLMDMFNQFMQRNQNKGNGIER